MEQDPIKILSEARKRMVDERRRIVQYLARAYDREQLEAHIHMIQKIQDAIDIIDRISLEERASLNREVDGHTDRSQSSPVQTEHATK